MCDAATSSEQHTYVRIIDCSYGEGGGQVIRNACAYASILQQNLLLTNIRAGRQPKPGLRPQHLVGLQLLADACGGQVLSADCFEESTTTNGSEEIPVVEDAPVAIGVSRVLFVGAPSTTTTNSVQNNSSSSSSRKGRKRPRPESSCNNEIVGDTQTAGSICLLLQAVLPYALFSSCNKEDNDVACKLILRGGTNATMAPPIDYFEHVFVPTLLQHTNLGRLPESAICTNVLTRGFYPKGGGHVEVVVQPPRTPWTLSPIRLMERGDITQLRIRAFTAGNLHSSVAKKLAAIAKAQLKEYFANDTDYAGVPLNVELSHLTNAVGSGCGILLVAQTSTGCLMGSSAIGSRKVSNEDTVRQATSEMRDLLMSGAACVDDYLQDQLILYMALAKGTSEILTNGITLHTRTAIWLAEQLCEGVRFEVAKLHDNNDNDDEQSRLGETHPVPRQTGNDHRDGKISGLHRIRCHGMGFSLGKTGMKENY